MRAVAAWLYSKSYSPRSINKDHMRTNRDVRLNNQRHAELLRGRIEELDQRLALLISERGRFERLLGGIRE